MFIPLILPKVLFRGKDRPISVKLLQLIITELRKVKIVIFATVWVIAILLKAAQVR